MILSRYRYRPVTIPLPLQRYRDSPSATVTDRSPPLPNVTERYRTLPTVNDRYRILPLLALQALPALR